MWQMDALGHAAAHKNKVLSFIPSTTIQSAASHMIQLSYK